MDNFLNITGEDIASLGDAELRELIGLLCESDYRLAGLPTNGITWGGHQDACDGGLDVIVRADISPPENSFVPRSKTGFQVKKSDMPKTKILNEMRPKGALREEIKALIKVKGAYIIVSANGSTADKALNSRIEAMKKAVADEEVHQDIHLDFFDRGRIATWVRSHPSLILWVRNKIDKPVKGWRPYENWANAPGGLEEDYIIDDGLRLHDGTKPTEKGLSVTDGLLRLRAALSMPGKSVRLAGLSGVGKTRLIQALFDERLGEHALNPSKAFYTDIPDDPLPDPGTLANQLITEKTSAILIVDNCPPDLHRRLTQTCSKQQSTVSLLTVEYDVRDDLPEETSVFRLEPASNEIIEKLIRKRFSHIGQVDARMIANFSGGNARVAIALGNTVQQGETVSNFRNDELFERLFWQRYEPNESLLVSAEACSLFYSFEGKDVSSEGSELKFIASLVNKSGNELYRDVAELKRRDLIQSRSKWRAVLPHAIANRLARRALESLPQETLVARVLSCGSERLIRSFTRRLSYLHDCETAVDIVDDWIGQDGWIGKSTQNLNSLRIDVLKNIAPVSPEKTLDAIERAASGPEGSLFTSMGNPHYDEFVRLLRHLAYDAALFDRSVRLLCRYALSERNNKKQDSTFNNTARDTLTSLFYIYLSGTHATIEARARVISQLVDSENYDKQELGLHLLDAALEIWHFSSFYDFSFGARPRDYGYNPETRDEISCWLDTFISICTRLALSGRTISEDARKLLAKNLRGLWTKGHMFDTLEASARRIHEQSAWNNGWLAIREIIRYDSKVFEEEVRGRIHRLEKLLKPANLFDQARVFALSDQHGAFDLEDDFDEDEDALSGWKRAEDTTRRIGAQVAKSTDTLNALMPDLLSTTNTRLYIFGMGLAEGCRDKRKFMHMLRDEIKKIPPDKRQISVILGFLKSCSKSDLAFFNATLDDLINDDVLGVWLPILQTTSTIDERGVERLHNALDVDKAPIDAFRCLAWGRAHESISDDDLAGLLRKIYMKEGGFDVVIDILKMRFHGQTKESPQYSASLTALARDVLSEYKFEVKMKERQNLDYVLAAIARICINGREGIPAAIQISQNLANAIKGNHVYDFDYPHLLNCLAESQPIVFLDIFLGSDGLEDYQRRRMFSNDVEMRGNPLTQIPDDELISWCESDPHLRYPRAALAINAFRQSDESGKLEWHPVVHIIFERAPDLGAVLENLAAAIRPRGWSGSLADILQRRLVLFQTLSKHENAEIRAWANHQYSELQKNIRMEREWEERRAHEQNGRFE